MNGAHEMHNKKSAIKRAREHLRKNGLTYVVAGLTAVAGVTGAVLLEQGTINGEISRGVRRSHPGNIVRHLETGATFPSQNVAAEVMGISASNLSRHLHGKLNHVKGQHFKVIGKAS